MGLVKINIAVFFWLLIVTGLMSSCFDNSDCSNFYADSIDVRFLKVHRPDSITASPLDLEQVSALEAGQLLFNAGTNAVPTANMSFPVNILSDTTTYIFQQTEKNDTLVAIFRRRPILINPECGMSQIIDIETIFSTFDSAKVVNPELRYSRPGTQNSHNIEIYF